MGEGVCLVVKGELTGGGGYVERIRDLKVSFELKGRIQNSQSKPEQQRPPVNYDLD